MKITLRVLCLEDDDEDFDIISKSLQKAGLSIKTSRVDNRIKFIDALTSFRPDVILSDHSLPAFDSTEALSICKATHPNIPFIIVTGAMSDEFAVKSLKLGADDYVLKSNLAKLPSVIKSALKQKDAEAAQKRAAQELAVRNEELSKINKELDSCVYSVSHNLRAPLMSVLGLVNLAKQEKDISNMREYHQLIENSILKLDETLKEVLEYARNARQAVKADGIDFQEILERHFREMQFMPGFARIQKEISINGSVSFFSDQYRLSVIFNNLISNAIKYADRDKTESFIRISVAVNEKHASIVFQDNGIGINEASQSKVFDMFFRATDVRDGAGLGLFIVREAVEMLGATIKIESKLGEGTRFEIEVPNLLNTASGPSISSLLLDRG